MLSSMVWKSTVIANGVPSSSFRAYLLPIDALELSIRLEMPIVRSDRDILLVTGVNKALEDNGSKATFVGATDTGSDRTCSS